MDSGDMKMESRPAAAGRWKVFALTGLILSSLLVATVGVIIYIALNPEATCVKTKAVPADIEETIHMKGSDKHEVDETMSYNSRENIAILTAEDGTFNLHDYNKGLHITKDINSGICYVTPTNSSVQDGQLLKKYIRTGNASFALVGEQVNMNILPGKIPDTSFLPAAANDYCFNGYQWLTVSQVAQTSESHEIVKRAAPGDVVVIVICCGCGNCLIIVGRER